MSSYIELKWVVNSCYYRREVGMCILYLCVHIELINIPIVPHNAVAEVSKIGHYRKGELL